MRPIVASLMTTKKHETGAVGIRDYSSYGGWAVKSIHENYGCKSIALCSHTLTACDVFLHEAEKTGTNDPFTNKSYTHNLPRPRLSPHAGLIRYNDSCNNNAVKTMGSQGIGKCLYTTKDDLLLSNKNRETGGVCARASYRQFAPYLPQLLHCFGAE